MTGESKFRGVIGDYDTGFGTMLTALLFIEGACMLDEQRHL